jgi:hypothetical protein
MCASLLAFFATCFSDPGTVTAANVEEHLAKYPFDGLLYTPKRCRTMRITCPARSKFSAVTNRRVARFDHFCGWMNNDIGARAPRRAVRSLRSLYFLRSLCSLRSLALPPDLSGQRLALGLYDHRHLEFAFGFRAVCSIKCSAASRHRCYAEKNPWRLRPLC